jgi:opacity protein-like surface antigen
MDMHRFRATLIVCLTCAMTSALTCALAAPARAATRGPKPPFARKAEKPFLAKPIEPMPEREEKPRAGWNGAYVGINAGGGFTDR